MTKSMIEGIIYQTQISLINNIVDKFGDEFNLNANDLVSKYIYKQKLDINEKKVNKKKTKLKKLLVIE